MNENKMKSVQGIEVAEQRAANGLAFSEIRQVVSEQMQGYGQTDEMSVLKLVRLLGSAMTAKKDVYDLTFVKEDDNCWYIDFPSWPWHKWNLQMVCGADKMLDLLAATPQNDQGLNRVRVEVKPASEAVDETTWEKLYEEDWVELTQVKSSLTGGATYTLRGKIGKDFMIKDYWTGGMKPRTLWLCPVTLFVIGQYPKYFYGRVLPGCK